MKEIKPTIGIVTEAIADIPPSLAAELCVHIIPTHVVLDGKDYRDGIDRKAEDIYRHFYTYRTMNL